MNRFLVLRDAYGSVQAILPDSKKHQFEEMIKSLNYESVLRIRGVVRNRGKARNPKTKTGDIEVSSGPETVLASRVLELDDFGCQDPKAPTGCLVLGAQGAASGLGA